MCDLPLGEPQRTVAPKPCSTSGSPGHVLLDFSEHSFLTPLLEMLTQDVRRRQKQSVFLKRFQVT